VLANVNIAVVTDGRFLVLPHAKVSTCCQRKAADHDRWIQSMQRFRRRRAGEEQ
jgi:hypothetical protein